MKYSTKIILALLTISLVVIGLIVYSNDRQNRLNQALFTAAVANDTAAIESLINQGADVNAREAQFSSTALHFASAQGSKNAAKQLLDQGADANAKDKRGVTSLMSAAKSGHAPTVRLLLSRGANTQLKDSRGKTALDEAVRFQSFYQRSPSSLRLTENPDYGETVHLLQQK